MKTKTEFNNPWWIPLRKRLAMWTGMVVLCVAAVNSTAQTQMVTNCTETALRMAMAGGGIVTFACDGVITLTGTITNDNDTVLDGSGHNITISGGDAVRIFYNSTNTSLTLINVTIADGRSTNGAGIFNDGGQLTLSQVILQSNIASIDWSNKNAPQGGGIFNAGGTVNAANCSFVGNAALGSESTLFQLSDPTCCGGAILNAGGELNLENCVFTGNSVSGSHGSSQLQLILGADGTGGAIYNSGTFNANGCTFLQNSAIGGDGEHSVMNGGGPGSGGGTGSGGAIFNVGTATIKAGSFHDNSAVGGAAGWSGSSYNGPSGGSANGGAICNSGDLQIESSAFFNNGASGSSGGGGGGGWWGGIDTTGPLPGGSGGPGGSGNGGAICNFGSVIVQRSLMASNNCTGASGGHGGTGAGYIDGRGQHATDSAGVGGSGGAGNGGALFSSGSSDLVNNTLAFNTGTGMHGGNGGNGADSTAKGSPCPGGDGANGGDGGAGSGGICGSVHMTNCTVAFNYGFAGAGGAGGGGGAGNPGGSTWPPGPPGNPGEPGTNGVATGHLTSGSLLVNSILASGVPSNCGGSITDAGHNLSSDNSCAFTNVGSLNNTDPMLGPLADNGGPTLTMALLPGSPAIDAGDDAAAPSTDQRGFPRPIGAASDIGAYECNPPHIATTPPDQTAEAESSVQLVVDAFGDPATGYLWFFNGTNLIGCDTNCRWELTNCDFSESGTYTVVVTNAFGAVTSAPVMLNVIPKVARRPVPGVRVMGDVGSSLNVEYTDALGPLASWLPLDTLSLTNSPQVCFDVSVPPSAQRFYRVWQAGTPSMIPSLNLNFVPAITLTGSIGNSLRLDCINQFGPTDAWVTLDTVTLTNTSQLYFDTSAIGQPARLYRIVPVP